MNTKSQVLKLLKCSGGKFLSGQEMAEQIYVTRASIWKAIKALEKDGYAIEAVTNKGYRLVNAIDNIDAANIKLRLDEEGFNINVKYYDEIDSTNDEARRFAQNENSDCLIIANQQTKGRGRRGRTFFSPKDSGIYMSLIVHVGKNVEKLSSITAVAAVSVAKAVDTVVYNEQNTSLIKWVNDVYIADKKVSGILTEAYSFMEDEEAGYLIIGFGINVYEPQTGFPKEIKNTAGFLLKGVEVAGI